MSSNHNGSGYFNVTEDDHLTEEHFKARLAGKNTTSATTSFARTGYLGFIKRTELTQTDGGKVYTLYEEIFFLSHWKLGKC